MRKLLLGAITILILACSENKENEGMQSASSAIKTRSGTWILEQVKDTYVFGEQLQLQCSGEGYSGKIHSAVLEMKTDTNEKYLAISSGSCADLDFNNVYAFKLGKCYIKVTIFVLTDTGGGEQDFVEEETNVLEFRVKGPSISNIMKMSEVTQRMDECWKNSILSEKSHSRREFGFTLQMHTYSNAAPKYSFIDGSAMSSNDCSTGGINTITFTIRTNEYNESASYSVALFHTHPPLTNCPSTSSRITGPSSLDDDTSNTNKIPSVIFDYGDRNEQIYGGHSSNLPYVISYAGSYDQRL